jgi:protein associated with RNAse G/E
MMSSSRITINSRNFDGTLRKSWTAELLQNSGGLLTAKGIFDIEMKHAHMDVIRRGTVSFEYFWLDRWYNVFRFHESDGAFRNYYCNVCMPPLVRGAVLDYVDLDIDLIVDAAGAITILDEEEFRESAQRFNYPTEIYDRAAEAIALLTDLIERREFPFRSSE